MSIHAVAKLAKVSPATVSRVINDSPLVSAALAAKVRQAMAALGYVPPPPELRRGPKPDDQRGDLPHPGGQVALLALGLEEAVTRNATDYLAKAAGEEGLSLVVAPARSGGGLPAVIQNRKVDGAILMGSEPSAADSAILQKLPVVWFMTRRSSTFWADFVEPDNWANGTLAAEYLLKQGHRHCAVLNIQPNYPAFRQRCHALTDVLRDQNVQVLRLDQAAHDPDAVLHEELNAGRVEILKAQVRLLAAAQPRVTGLYVPNAVMAPLLLSLLERHGLRPCQDLDLILGDYDPELNALVEKPLAQIDVQIPLIARRALQLLRWRMNHPSQPGPVGQIVTPRLVLGS